MFSKKQIHRMCALVLMIVLMAQAILPVCAADVPTPQLVAARSTTDEISITPNPNYLERLEGTFTLTAETNILYNEDDPAYAQIAAYLQKIILQSTGWELALEGTALKTAEAGSILITATSVDGYGEEGYWMHVDEDAVTMRSYRPAGAFYAVQSLLQLLPTEIYSTDLTGDVDWTAPCVLIKDAPAYKWRGLMLDCSRHFFTVDEIKDVLDQMAITKLNRLHWHFTDDNGWRMEVKGYPNLTEFGATQIDNGAFPDEGQALFYTQEDIKEIVAYAQDLQITVVPEIELPGHALAAILSYPELYCVNEDGTTRPYPKGKNGKDMIVTNFNNMITNYSHFTAPICLTRPEAVKFLHTVLDQVMELFPGEYIHIGGDEVPNQYKNWDQCASCSQVMAEKGLTNADMQSYLAAELRDYVAANGKKVMGWSEIFNHGAVPGVALTDWIGGGATALAAGCEVVACSTGSSYLDYRQDPEDTFGDNGCSMDRVYNFEPAPASLSAEKRKLILGSQGNLWSHIVRSGPEAKFQLFPRMCAVAERNWSTPDNKSYDDFLVRMEKQYERMAQTGIDFNIPEPVCAIEGTTLTIRNPAGKAGTIHYTTDGTTPDEKSPAYTEPVTLNPDVKMVKAITVIEPTSTKQSHVVSQATGAMANYYHWSFDDETLVEENGALDGTAEGTIEYIDGPTALGGKAAKFADAEAAIKLSGKPITGEWTFSTWVKETSNASAFSFLISDSKSDIRLLAGDGSKKLQTSIHGQASKEPVFDYAVPLNTWTMLSFVQTSAGLSLYVNGALQQSLPGYNMPLPTDMLGNYVQWGKQALNASLDDVWIVKKALSVENLGKLYNGSFNPDTDVPAAHMVTATYGQGGVITPERLLVEEGQDCTLQIVPIAGYQLKSLTLDGSDTLAKVENGTLVLKNVQEPHTVHAEFEKKPLMTMAGSYWKFDGNADDENGVNNGAIRGIVSYVEGHDGTASGAIQMDNKDAGVLLAAKDIVGEWTASVWVKRLTTTPYSYLLFSANSSLRLTQYETDQKVGMSQTGVVDKSFDYVVPLNEWKMLTFTYANGVTKFYVDGAYLASLDGVFTLPMMTLGNSLSNSSISVGAPLQAALDDMVVYPKMLTEEQVAALYEGKYPTLAERPVESCVPLAGCTVSVGTTFEELLLPKTVTVKLADDDREMFATANVTWQKPDNFAQTVGTQMIYGTIETPDYTVNDANVQAVYPVTVQKVLTNAELVEEAKTLLGTTITVPYGKYKDDAALAAAATTAAQKLVTNGVCVTVSCVGSVFSLTLTKENASQVVTPVTVVIDAAPSGGGMVTNKTTITVKNADGSISTIVTDQKTGTVVETAKYPDGTTVVTTTKDGKSSTVVTVSKTGEKTTVTIHTATKPGAGMVAVIVRPDGTKEVIRTSVATADGVQITVTAGAKIVLIDNSKTFSDVQTGDWFKDAVAFVSSRELFSGTSADKFSPMAPMTRAMLMTVLYRYEGANVKGEGSEWYADAMSWAKQIELSDGSNPNGNVTREQLAVILYRYAKPTTATKGDVSKFADSGSVSDFATEAMRWAVGIGLIGGKGNNKLDPQGSATRVEVAAILMRFCENIK